MIEIGLAGKPNSGKSTFFGAATLAEVEIADYPFTTIKPNVGIGYVRVECACKQLGIECSNCVDGWRFIPVKLIDVAGLVPGAHEGRGLGNEFLDNLRQSEAIIHVVDGSGSTDAEGNEVGVGKHDPADDIDFLYTELDMWLLGVLNRNWNKIIRRINMEKRDPVRYLTEQLAGLGFEERQVKESMRATGKDLQDFSEEDVKNFAVELRKRRMKTLVVANKADKAPEDVMEKLLQLDDKIIPTSAALEISLQIAAQNSFIKYLPGDEDFEVLKELNEKQKKGLETARKYISKFRGTGVQKAINSVVFDLLDYIVVYPVEDENKYTDTKGNVLPDAFLVKKGTTAKGLAYQIHTDIGKHFIHAVDARKKMRIADDHQLEHNDVIKIASGAK
ncbi:MAG: redox-regulated ATPase YchF [Archaeoglobaceae archaeon]